MLEAERLFILTSSAIKKKESDRLAATAHLRAEEHIENFEIVHFKNFIDAAERVAEQGECEFILDCGSLPSEMPREEQEKFMEHVRVFLMEEGFTVATISSYPAILDGDMVDTVKASVSW